MVLRSDIRQLDSEGVKILQLTSEILINQN
jgi:hypothetical protein